MKMKRIYAAALAAVMSLGVFGSAGAAKADRPDDYPALLLKENSIRGSLYGKPDPANFRYRSLTVKIGDKEKTFAWQPMMDSVDYISSSVLDLDADGLKEWLLALTLNTGTEIVDSEARVLRGDLSEIKVENPKKAANSALKSWMRKADGKVIYTVSVNGKPRTFTFDETDAIWWFDGPYAGNVVRYAVEHGRLTARLGTQVSPGMWIGTTKVYYEYKKGELRASQVVFTRNL